MRDRTKLTVFYDGTCPLCTREIAVYRRLRGADTVSWVDVGEIDGTVVVPGLTKDDALRRFHVMHPDGRISSGGVAFAYLWAALPGTRRLGHFFLGKPWRCLLDGAYTVFLPARPLLRRVFGAMFRQKG